MTDEELKAIERRLVIDQDDDADALARHARADASALIAALVATEADRDRAREELAEAESELDGYDKSLKTSYERLAADGVTLKELRADRDRARDAAVALEQETAQLQDVLKVTDRLERSTRDEVAQARDAVYEGRSGEALDMLSDLLERLGGKR